MSEGFGPQPIVIHSIYQMSPEAIEEFCQYVEMRGLRMPVSQIVGYQRDRLTVWLEQAVAQSIPDNTQTPVTFDTVRTDKQKVFNGTSTLTLPYAGTYLAVMQGGFVAGVGTIRTFVITQNGTGRAVVDKAAVAERVSLSAMIVGSKGDTVKAEQYQNSGGALNTFGCSFGLTLLNSY